MKITGIVALWLLVACFAQAKGITQKQAIDKATKQTPGKVLSVKTQTIRAIPIHSVKVLTDKGRVKTVKVNGQTGAIIKD